MLEGEWEVTEMAIGGELVTPIEGSRLTVEIADGRVAGSAGVNRYMGPVSDEGFGLLATTMMAGPPELMGQEQIFLELLDGVDAWEQDDNAVCLLESGIVTLCLRPVELDGEEPNKG